MALPPGFIANGPFVDFNPGGFSERDVEKFMIKPWKEFAMKADAIAAANERRIAELEARVARLEAVVRRRQRHERRKPPRTARPAAKDDNLRIGAR